MKISFSTLGCPNWSFGEIVSTAKDLGYSGIEIRGIENEIYAPKIKEFLPANIEKTMTKLSKLELEISCLTSGALLNGTEQDHIKEYIDLASKLGVKYVRVLGDKEPYPDESVQDSVVSEALKDVAAYAKPLSVTMLIESNGVYAKSERLAKLVRDIDNVGVLWDVHHPYREFGETMEETHANIGKYVRHVHFKDSVVVDGKSKYKMMGYGDIPFEEALRLLKSGGFDEYISLEWVKRWYSDLEEPGVAFAQCIGYLKKNME